MQETRILKKYANRRLYDTAISSYITIADVKQMIVENTPIQVVDAKSGEDLTRQVYLQILLEEEAHGTPLLSDEMLYQIIRLYGQASQSVFAPFLEQNMRIFAEWQKTFQQQAKTVTQATPWLAADFPSGSLNFLEWQKSLQQQAVQFWQNTGFLPKNDTKD